MTVNNEQGGYPDDDLAQFEALVSGSGLEEAGRFQQAATMSHFVVKRDILSDILQDKKNFAVFADMMNRDGKEFDEV